MIAKGTENSINSAVGASGSLFINSTDIFNSTDMKLKDNALGEVQHWSLIHCTEDTSFSILIDQVRSTLSDEITSTGVTFSKGTVLGGKFKTIALRSGRVAVYV